MRLTLAVILLSSFYVVNAQDQFMAYSITGSATYTINNRQMPIKVGKILDASKTVKIGPKSSITLICNNSSNTIQLKEGSHQLGQLTASCAEQKNSLMANYFQFVWWQMTHPKASAAEEKKRSMLSLGAVTRGCPALIYYLPDTINYYQENIVLRWKLDGPVSDREFVLFQHENSPAPLLKKQPPKNFILLDSIRNILEPSHQYYWTIQIDNKETCPRNLIQVWGKEDYQELVDNLTKQIPEGLDEAEQNYTLGFLLEQNRFFGEAFYYYKLANYKQPYNNRYKKTVRRYNEMFRAG